MITVHFTSANETISHVRVKGHAGYKTKGKDIVCAAVSTALIITANAIERLKLNQHVDLTIEEGYFDLVVNEVHEINEGLLQNLKFALLDLEKQYPKYIKNQKEG